MIRRFYFMTYQTGAENGIIAQGSMAGSSKSWLPIPGAIHDELIKKAMSGLDGKQIVVTSFQRVR